MARDTPVPDADGSVRHGKIEIPAVPAPFVPRPDLRAELDLQADAAGPGGVVLVSAAAGYGKTAAVADWVRASPARPTAWVRLDTGDRDEQQFWDSLLAALRACPGVPAESRLRILTAAWSLAGSGSRTAFVTAVLNAVDALPVPVRLVLDDVHVLVTHPGLQGLHDLLAHRLPTLSLVLISRLDPPVGLHRLRLEGRLGEVRARRLTFTSDETTQLFAAQAPQLTPAQVGVLYDRTEGWVAALRLAVVSLRGRDDPAGFVDEFAGDDRGVADYLIGEILGGLGERDRAVLDATSVCDTITAELAVTLSGRDDAGEALESLEERTALLTPTDAHRIHYRAHDLLRSHILARLRRRHPATLAQLHLRAAQWHGERREHLEEVRYTALAGDPRATRAALRAHAVELIGRGQFGVVADTIARVADDDGPDHRLELVTALVEIEQGSVAVASGRIDDAERYLDGDDGNVGLFLEVVRTRRALAEGRTADAVAAARALRPDAADGLPLRALTLLTRGNALMGVDPDLARADCDHALALADRHEWPYLGMQVLTTMGILDASDPRRRTTAAAWSAHDRATSQGWQDSAWAVGTQIVLAATALMRCEPTAARGHVDQARQGGLAAYPQLATAIGTLDGAVEHDLGQRLDGWRRMRLARHQAGAVDLEDRQVAFAALLEHDAALGLDRHREAAEVLRWATGRLGDSGGELALMHARQQWAARRDPTPRVHLTPVLEGRIDVVLPETVLAADLLDAEIALHRGERTTARSRLDHALALGADLDVLRPFTVAPDPIRRLLAEAADGIGKSRRFIGRILAVGEPQPDRPGTPPAELTDREHTVLALLPTQRSLQEIADDLTVSPNTVKTHLRAIYAKLGAGSRREAVIRARHDQLLHSPAEN